LKPWSREFLERVAAGATAFALGVPATFLALGSRDDIVSYLLVAAFVAWASIPVGVIAKYGVTVSRVADGIRRQLVARALSCLVGCALSFLLSLTFESTLWRLGTLQVGGAFGSLGLMFALMHSWELGHVRSAVGDE